MSRLCAWCPLAPESRRARAVRPASHGICPPCLAAELRSDRAGYTRSGARFTVWDEDARAGAAWAAELAALEAAPPSRARRASAQA